MARRQTSSKSGHAGGRDAPPPASAKKSTRKAPKALAAALRPAAAPRSRPGLPTKCTPERVAKMAEAIKAGCTHYGAAMMAGISREAFQKWLARGRKERARLQALGDEDAELSASDPTEAPYLDFTERIEVAEGEFEARAVLLIAKAAERPEHWQAAKFLLERRRPDDYGPREKLEVGGTVNHEHVLLQPEEQRRAQEILERYGFPLVIDERASAKLLPGPTANGSKNGEGHGDED